jgi:predicted  nucleic acid-binding Zn-ribbon protein
MDETQVRERVTRWIDEGRDLFALLPELLGAEKEAELLRRELMELRKELAESKSQSGDMQKEHGDLHKQLEALRQENEQLMAEKAEAGQALAKVLETVQATNHIAQKLGVTRSPFARRDTPAVAPQPAAAPHPAANE